MAGIEEMARNLGQALGRTDEYQALRRAMEAADDDRPLSEARSRMREVEERVERALRSGKEPDDDLKREYEEAYAGLQSTAAYQRLVAAQSNFDKILAKVNETISRGIDEAAKSRIVLPS